MKRFLSRAIKWLLIAVALVAAIFVAVGNKHGVSVNIYPTPFVLADIPLYAVMFVSVLAGIVIGGISAWAQGGRWRKLARHRGRQTAGLEAENRTLRAEAATPVDRLDSTGTPPELAAPPQRADAA